MIAKDNSAETAQWMVASTFDSDEGVRAIAKQWLLEHPVDEAEWWRVRNLIFNNEAT